MGHHLRSTLVREFLVTTQGRRLVAVGLAQAQHLLRSGHGSRPTLQLSLLGEALDLPLLF